jgi:hypothetical protein
MKGPLRLIITAMCAGIVGVLAFYAAITTTIVPGVAAIYPAVAFEATFGAWFGIWGAISSFLGLLIAGSVSGWFSMPIGIILSMSDFMVAFAGAIACRWFRVDPSLPTFRDSVLFVIVTWGFGSIPSSLYYNGVNFALGVIPSWESFWIGVIGWNLGNLIIIPVIGIPLMKTVTVIVRRLGLYVEGLL